MQANTNDQQISLEATKVAFDQWRLSKSSRSEAVPQYLWEMVKSLPCHNDVSKMRTVLGITRDQLNKYVFNSSDNKTSRIVADDFMRVQPQIPTSDCNLKIQHRDGHHMMITSTESFVVSAIKVFINGDA